MNDEELKKAIDIIINKPIIIQNMTSEDNKEYIGFDKENFETLEQTYYNCQYFARIQEQLMINLKDKDKEINRLNNIINEMEKFLKICSEKDDYDWTEYNKGVNNAYNYTLDKLKELKGDKE